MKKHEKENASVVVTHGPISLGMELPHISRQWSPKLFEDRHETVYGAGHIVDDAWPARSIHSDNEAAQREGLPEAVGSAPQFFAQIHRSMMGVFGIGWIAGGRMDVKMIRPVYAGDFTVAKGRVAALVVEPSEEAAGPMAIRAECDVWVERQDGEKVVVGKASALVTV